MIVASNFKTIGKGTLVGSADLFVTKWRFTFFGCLWHRKGEQEWISLPAKEWTNLDGKKIYTALGRFSSHDDTRRFSEAAIAAIKLIAAGSAEPRHQPPAAQQKFPGVATSSRRRHGLYTRPRRAEVDRDLPNDEVGDLWQPERDLVP
jgi:hypothetical protein